MKPVVFLSSARSDLWAEVDYYRAIDPRVASRFAAAIKSAARFIAEHPEAMQIIESEVRRWPVQGFPHGVLYRIEASQVVVLAVFHPRRDPAIWKGRT